MYCSILLITTTTTVTGIGSSCFISYLEALNKVLCVHVCVFVCVFVCVCECVCVSVCDGDMFLITG